MFNSNSKSNRKLVKSWKIVVFRPNHFGLAPKTLIAPQDFVVVPRSQILVPGLSFDTYV